MGQNPSQDQFNNRGWGQYIDQQTATSPGLTALRRLGAAQFPKLPDMHPAEQPPLETDPDVLNHGWGQYIDHQIESSPGLSAIQGRTPHPADVAAAPSSAPTTPQWPYGGFGTDKSAPFNPRPTLQGTAPPAPPAGPDTSLRDPEMSFGAHPTLEDLRGIRDFLGIQSGSSVDSDVKSVLGAPGQIASGLGQVGKGAWDSLTKVPVQLPPTFNDQPSPGRGIPSFGQAPTEPAPPDPIRAGIKYDGPKLNTEAALAGLKGFQDQHEAESQANYIPTEELWKQGFRDPEQMAPGAGQWAGHELQERLGDQDFEKNLQQKSHADIAGAETQLNPIVQTGANAQAQRAALPAQVNANAAVEVAKIRNQDPYLNALAKTLSTGGQGNFKSVGRSGVSFQSDPNMAPYYNALVQAQKSSGGLFGGNRPLSQAQQNFVSAYHFQGSNPAKAREILQTVLRDPSAPIDPTGLTEEDIQEIESIHDVLTREALQ